MSDYSKLSFGKAFSSARNDKLKVFTWKGNKYSTELAEEAIARGGKQWVYPNEPGYVGKQTKDKPIRKFASPESPGINRKGDLRQPTFNVKGFQTEKNSLDLTAKKNRAFNYKEPDVFEFASPQRPNAEIQELSNERPFSVSNLSPSELSSSKKAFNVDFKKQSEFNYTEPLKPVKKLSSYTIDEISIAGSRIDPKMKSLPRFKYANENKLILENNPNFDLDLTAVNKNRIDSGIDYFFLVDKSTGAIYKGNIDTQELQKLGEVGLGKVIGDRDVSKGRVSGRGSNMTQSGWVRINRESKYQNRSDLYGEEWHGFEAKLDSGWTEIPTGIHGTNSEPFGRVSGGCTRMNCDLEEKLKDELKPGVMIYYTKDK